MPEICDDLGGKVEKVFVDQDSYGNVWVKFKSDGINVAKKTQSTLNDRYFDGRKIMASFVPESVFNSKFSERG
jgi:hypothetical protein